MTGLFENDLLFDLGKEKVGFTDVLVANSDRGGDGKSEFQASLSGEKQNKIQATVNDVHDSIQTKGRNCEKNFETNSNLVINSDSKLNVMLNEANNNGRMTGKKLSIERDKKRSISTILAPNLASTEKSRRASYAGVTNNVEQSSDSELNTRILYFQPGKYIFKIGISIF